MPPSTFLCVFLMLFLLAVVLLGTLDVGRVDRAHELIARGSPLVDVDPPEVFLHAHPHGAINIPLEDIARVAREILDPTQVIVVHGHWFRAFLAARELRARGFFVLNIGSAST